MIKKKLYYYVNNQIKYLLYNVKYSIIFYYILFYTLLYIDKLKNVNIKINMSNSIYLTSYFSIINLHLNLNTNISYIHSIFINKTSYKYTLIKSAFVYKNSQEHLIKNTYVFSFKFIFKNINTIFLNYLITYFYKKKIKCNYNTVIYIRYNNKIL
jgi:hypothetical protein